MILPEIKKVVLPDCNFPTEWQTVIFRNYGLVHSARIASVLGCDEETVKLEAERLGLCDTEYEPLWERLGYITIIRNNWFLLPYSQLEALLGFTEERLAYVLKEEDFLNVKLGNYKPECKEVKYSPLNEEQIAKTEKIAAVVAENKIKNSAPAFRFFDKIDPSAEIPKPNGKTRFIHGYRTPCGDPFMEDSNDYLPDEVLLKYQQEGINGIWIHGILSTLSPYPFDEALSRGYETRRRNLSNLIERAKKFGIGIYLYFNEPRGLSEDTALKYSDIVGYRIRGMRCFCLSASDEPLRYLYSAMRDLLSECDIAGIITITMSENPTHCKFTGETDCPRCKDRPAYLACVEINNTIQRAINDSDSSCELIANLWGWEERRGWSREEIRRSLETLDPRASVVCVSESGLEIEKAGIKSQVGDYSVSNPGPSPAIARTFSVASEYGHKVYAKVQVNNSWECSAVPYLPVFDLVKEHLDNLYKIGIEDYMLSWTHGGYPSPTLNYIANYKPGEDIEVWYRSYYGKDAEAIHKAIMKICEGFRLYPFSVSHMYVSPQNIAAGNMWSLSPNDNTSAMIGYSFDDYEHWTTIYPYNVFLEETKKMLDMWLEGIRMLESIEQTEKVSGLLLFAKVAYRHLECDLIHTKYAYLKRDIEANKSELSGVVLKAKENAKALLYLSSLDSRIGYEASNHYYYTQNLLIEKILNCDKLLSELA